MQTTHLETERRAPAIRPERRRAGRVAWAMLTVIFIALLAVGAWFLVDYLTPTDTEAMLRDYVSDWENGNFADLPDYFALNGTLVNATTGTTFGPDEMSAEMVRLGLVVGEPTVNVSNLVMGSSDRIAMARFEIAAETGDTLDGVAVWETVGGAIRQQTISYITVFEPRS